MNPQCKTKKLLARGGVEDTRLEAKAKDTKKFRGQGQTLSRPRTQTQEFSKKRSSKIFFRRKRSSKFFFRLSLLEETKKKVFADFPRVFWRFPTKFQRLKIVLSSSRGQGNFLGLEASRPRPRTSKCVLEDILEAKDVLEDSTSAFSLVD